METLSVRGHFGPWSGFCIRRKGVGKTSEDKWSQTVSRKEFTLCIRTVMVWGKVLEKGGERMHFRTLFEGFGNTW